MNTRVKFGIAALVLCCMSALAFCMVEISRSGQKQELTEAENLLRDRLFQAVESARRGNRKELDITIEAMARGRALKVRDKLLPDFILFLDERDAQVQLLGARGLYILKSPKSKEILVRDLKRKDFFKLAKRVQARDLKPLEHRQLRWEIQASALAIWTLGKVGDESVIPLLKSLQEFELFQFEWGSYPVEEALAELGAIESLCNIPPHAEQWKIRRAAHTLANIRDPNKTGELMKTVRDENIADSIRHAAISALGGINSPGVPGFLIAVANDSSSDGYLRSSAAVAAGKTQNRSVERPLLVHARNPDSDIRAYAFVGLVLCVPDKYLDRWFEILVDPNEHLEFRERLAGMESYVPRDLLRDRRKELYNCLSAADKNGQPIDKIRTRTWCLINNLYKEEPEITLTTKSSRVTSSLRHPIETRIRQSNPRIGYNELRTKVDEVIEQLVSVYTPYQQRRE